MFGEQNFEECFYKKHLNKTLKIYLKSKQKEN